MAGASTGAQGWPEAATGRWKQSDQLAVQQRSLPEATPTWRSTADATLPPREGERRMPPEGLSAPAGGTGLIAPEAAAAAAASANGDTCAVWLPTVALMPHTAGGCGC